MKASYWTFDRFCALLFPNYPFISVSLEFRYLNAFQSFGFILAPLSCLTNSFYIKSKKKEITFLFSFLFLKDLTYHYLNSPKSHQQPHNNTTNQIQCNNEPFQRSGALSSPLSFPRSARSRSPSPAVPQEPSSSEPSSAVIPASLLVPRGMLKRGDAADYNPARRRGDSPSVLPPLLLCCPPSPLRCAALQWPCCPVTQRGGCSHTACPQSTEGGGERREGFYQRVAGPRRAQRLPH